MLLRRVTHHLGATDRIKQRLASLRVWSLLVGAPCRLTPRHRSGRTALSGFMRFVVVPRRHRTARNGKPRPRFRGSSDPDIRSYQQGTDPWRGSRSTAYRSTRSRSPRAARRLARVPGRLGLELRLDPDERPPVRGADAPAGRARGRDPRVRPGRHLPVRVQTNRPCAGSCAAVRRVGERLPPRLQGRTIASARRPGRATSTVAEGARTSPSRRLRQVDVVLHDDVRPNTRRLRKEIAAAAHLNPDDLRRGPPQGAPHRAAGRPGRARQPGRGPSHRGGAGATAVQQRGAGRS